MTDLMVVAVSQYTAPLEEVDLHVPAHREWIERQYSEGRFLVSGRRTPPEGGVLVFRAASLEDAEALLATDPFTSVGVAEYSLYPFGATPAPWRSAALDVFLGE